MHRDSKVEPQEVVESVWSKVNDYYTVYCMFGITRCWYFE
jgi:hypothetical protein